MSELLKESVSVYVSVWASGCVGDAAGESVSEPIGASKSELGHRKPLRMLTMAEVG